MTRFRTLGLVTIGLCLAACGQLLGLGDYEVGSDEATGGSSDGSGGATGGSGGETGGTGGDSTSGQTGGTGGDMGGTGGGTGGTGGDMGGTGGGTGGSSGGSGGSGGDMGVCENDDDCMVRNDCSLGSCDAGKCSYEPADAGTECGDGDGVCNGDQDAPACVECVDDAEGTDTDTGCSDNAPECEVDSDGVAACTGCESDDDCDDGNDCTGDTCDSGRCSSTALDAGEDCNGGVCNGNVNGPECVECIDDAAGLDTDTGCTSDAPTCETTSTPTCIECFDDEDCDDDNPCTDQDCINDFCEYTTLDEGDDCDDGVNGICNGSSGAGSCGACIDDAPGTQTDTGCTSGAAICDTSSTPYQCTGCIENDDCDDQIPCTVDTCTGGGVCSNAPNDSLCDSTGSLCDPVTCTGANTSDGCEVTDGRSYASLLVNGSFEASGGWIEVSNDGYSIIWSGPYTGTVDGSWVAWMGGAEYSEHDIYQTFDVPSNALELDVEFWYYIDDLYYSNAGDVAAAEFRESDATTLIHQFVSWDSNDSNYVWEQFTETYDATDIAGDTISMYFSSVNDDVDPTNFFIDAVSITAMCCGGPCN